MTSSIGALLSQIEMISNCPAISVTEKSNSKFSEIDVLTGCLIITVTENGSKLWSIRIARGDSLDQDGKEAVFYQLALRYNWLESKKEKMDFLIEIEQIILLTCPSNPSTKSAEV